MELRDFLTWREDFSKKEFNKEKDLQDTIYRLAIGEQTSAYYLRTDFKRLKSKQSIMAAFELIIEHNPDIKIDKNFTYQMYLKSYYWHIVSSYYKTFIRNSCALCGSNEKLNVHHSVYKSFLGGSWLGSEAHLIGRRFDILVTLCEKCHSKYHGVK